jgi:hypothetical protein
MTPQQKNQRFFTEIDRIEEIFGEDIFRKKILRCMHVYHTKYTAHAETITELARLVKDRMKYFDQAEQFEKTHIRIVSAYRAMDSKIAEAKQMMDTFDKEINAIKNEFAATDTQDIIDELFTINSIYPFNAEYGAWALPTFSLEDDKGEVFDFSGLYAYLNPNAGNSHEFIKVKYHGPCRDDHVKDEYPHPHISDSTKVCWGEAEYALNQFWKEKKFFTIFQLLCSVLGRYNSRSTYVELDRWTGSHRMECENCGASLDEDECCIVEPSGDYACDECSVYSQENDCRCWEHEAVFSNLCDSWLRTDDSTLVKTGYYTSDYLPKDHSDIVWCDECEEGVHFDFMTEIPGTHDNICIGCAEKIATKCKECDIFVLNEELIEDEYCEDCCEECSVCADLFPPDMLTSEGLCETCDALEEKAKKEEDIALAS